MDGLSRIRSIILIAACICASAKGNIFGKGKETIFSYTADVRTGTIDPASYASQFGVKSTLTVESNEDGSLGIFRLSNISVQVFNGELQTDADPEAKFLLASTKSLEEPFEVIYQNGLVKTILTNEKEECTLSTNMKKSIATILQLDMNKLHFDKNYSFPTEEKTIYGNCLVEYSVRSKQEGDVIIRKMPSHDCQGSKPLHYFSNTDRASCGLEAMQTLGRGVERIFEVHSSDDQLIIKKVLAQGKISYYPYPEGGFSQYIQVKQTFQLNSQHPSSKHEPYPGMKENEPTFIPLESEGNLHEYHIKATKEIMISLVQKQLHDLVDLLEEINVGGPNDEGGFLEQKQNEGRHRLSFQLLKTLRLLDYESLKNIYSVNGGGTSYREETLRDLILDLLSQAGTKASITLLRDLVVDQALTVKPALQILQTIPFYAYELNENLLQIYEGVMAIDYNDQVKQAATLSFATMVNRVCTNHKCTPEVLDTYILKYLELFKDSTEYQWKLNYLEGLSNIQIGNVVKYLEPIIKGELPYSHHIRFLAMWASYVAAIKDPQRVFEVYWPILEDKSEHLELRIGAFTILLLSNPQPDRFFSLAALMAEEPADSHLYYFFYSTMESLAGTTHPCNQYMKKLAQHVLLYATLPENEPLWTGNHMFEYINTGNKYGTFLQAFMIADGKTSLPNVLYFLRNEHFLGQNEQQFALYVKMQGLKGKIKSLTGTYSKDGDKLTKLQQLLSKYGVYDMVEQDDPVHIELIIKYKDKALMTYYYNETTLYKLFEAVDLMGSQEGDFHINYQHLLFPIISELSGPTDMGLPMSLTTQIPFLFSLRMNFIATATGFKNQIDIKYWKHGESFLSVYNPVGKLWHGISRSHSILLHLPINIQLDVSQNNLKFIISRNNEVPGIAIHAGSNVYIKPVLVNEDDSLKTLTDSCPSCVSVIPVKGESYHEKQEYENVELGKLKMNYVYRYFDCDVEDMPFLIDDAGDGALLNINDRFIDEIDSLLLMHEYDTLMRLPLRGRCGFVVKIMPKIESKINNLIGFVQFVSEDSKSEEQVKIMSRNPHKDKLLIKGSISQESLQGTAEQLYDFSLSYQESLGSFHHNLKFKFSSHDPSQEKLKMCLDAELHYPEPPVDPLKQREPEKEAVTGSINAVIGLASQNMCPKTGIVFKLYGRATPAPNKKNKNYEVCTEEAQTEDWSTVKYGLTPSTPSCYAAAIDSTELRRFEFKAEVSDLISDIIAKTYYAAYLEDGTDPWGEYIISSNYSINEYPVIKDGNGFVVEVTPEGYYLIDTIENDERERKVINYGSVPDFSSRFSSGRIYALKYKIINSCVVTESTVLGFNENYLSYDPSTCYALATGHCRSSNPLFAVMVRKTEVKDKLGFKVYSFANYLEVTPTSNNSIEVNVNGDHVDFDEEKGYEIRSGVSSFRMWRKHSKDEKDSPFYLHIYSSPSGIAVYYTGDRVITELNTLYAGDLCGLCGDFSTTSDHTNFNACNK